MRNSQPHVFETQLAADSFHPYAPNIHLNPDLAKEVLEISSYASLGFHTAAVIRLATREIIALTEYYPAALLPCNGHNAMSLFEVGQQGGPTLPAHELNLEIRGATTMEQIRTIRRIRGILPELYLVDVTKSQITFYHANLDAPLHYNDKQSIQGNCSQGFGRGYEIMFVEGDRPMHESITLSEAERLAIRKMASMAWSETKKRTTGNHKRLPHEDPLYKHVQTVLLDIPDREATLIEQGPHVRDSISTSLWRLDDYLPINLHSSRFGGKAWHDSARSAVLRSGVTPESVRVMPRGSELFVTALLPESTTGSFGKLRGPNEYPFTTRFWAIGNEDRPARVLFDLLPPSWNFRGIRKSSCDTMILLDADCHGSRSLPETLHSHIEKQLVRGVFYSHNRFQPASLQDPVIGVALNKLPFSSVFLAAKRCIITGEIQLTTVHPIPAQSLETLRSELGFEVSNTTPLSRAPNVIERPVSILSRGTTSPNSIPKLDDDNIRTLTVLGGAKNIGGSTLALGNLLLDCGAYPKTIEETTGTAPSTTAIPHTIQAAFITHAHLDHVGNVISLKDRKIPIFMHHATALVSWPLLLEQVGQTSGLVKQDLEELYHSIHPVPFGYRLQLSESVSATMVEAGHLAGSGMIVIEKKDSHGLWKAMYTGDLQRGDGDYSQRIYPPAATVCDVDALIIEATNGMNPVQPRAILEARLIESIKASLESGGRVLLPAIASRVPELLTLLTKHRNEFPAPIYIDGPALGASMEIHSYVSHVHPELFTHKNRSEQGWRGLQAGFLKDIKRNAVSQFFAEKEPRIVVMSGGMGQGTSIRHIKEARPEDTVIFTCYQAPGTLGHSLLNKYQAATHKNSTTEWDGPRILSERLSGHISGEQILSFVKSTLKPQGTVVLLHGGDDEKIAVKAALTEQGHAGQIIIARTGEEISL